MVSIDLLVTTVPQLVSLCRQYPEIPIYQRGIEAMAQAVKAEREFWTVCLKLFISIGRARPDEATQAPRMGQKLVEGTC